jgi:Domain of unknown function (DUF397)
MNSDGRVTGTAVHSGAGSQTFQETDVSEIYSGMPAAALHRVTWQKSRRSNSQGNCVEMAPLPKGAVAVRNSRHPNGPALVYTRAEIEAFILGAKDGDFDNLLS